MLLPLHAEIQRYPWGSTTLIQGLRGSPTDGKVIAEVWYGTHSRAPSRLARDDSSLLDLIQSDPTRWLGAPADADDDKGLPFLLKLIAVERALSIQAHPNAETALRGFQREQARGIPSTARERCYPDPHHKPELLVALSEFQALVGFEDQDRILFTLSHIDSPELRKLLIPLRDKNDLTRSFALLLNCDRATKALLLGALRLTCSRQNTLPPESASKYKTAAALLQEFPDDLGALVSLFMHRVTLQPGEAVYVSPGTLHAYLHGMGVEIMANSDNVLRCGLTPKHVDTTELLNVVDVSSAPYLLEATENPRQLRSLPSPEMIYAVPAAEFLLSRIDLQPGEKATLAARGAELLLPVQGNFKAKSEEATLTLQLGEAVFVPAKCRYELSGQGLCFRAQRGS